MYKERIILGRTSIHLSHFRGKANVENTVCLSDEGYDSEPEDIAERDLQWAQNTRRNNLCALVTQKFLKDSLLRPYLLEVVEGFVETNLPTPQSLPGYPLPTYPVRFSHLLHRNQGCWLLDDEVTHYLLTIRGRIRAAPKDILDL